MCSESYSANVDNLLSVGSCMTFSDFSITVSKKIILIQNVRKYNVYYFTTSNAKPDVDQIVFLIEPRVKNLIVC